MGPNQKQGKETTMNTSKSQSQATTYYTPLIARLPRASRVRKAYEHGKMSYARAVYAASMIIARLDGAVYDTPLCTSPAMLRDAVEEYSAQLRAREYELNQGKSMHPIPVD
jgi:hypothetical protein